MKKTNKGFTLLEIIIVLFLITLIMGLTGVFFAGYLPSVKFNAAGREISGTIRHARSLSRVQMASQTFIVDLDHKTYGIQGRPFRQLPWETSIRIIDPLSGEITQGKYSIVFHPSGGIEGGTIILSQKKKVLRIDMDPITGTVASTGL